jgi:hypothetical protein
MVVDQNTLMAEAMADAPAKEEALPELGPPTAQEPAVETTAAFTDIQIQR